MQWSQQASSHRRSTSNSARQLHDELKSVEDGGESPIADDTAYGAPALQADKIERVSKTGQPHENEPADENERVGSGRESPAALSEKKSSLLGAAAFFGLLGGLVGTIAGGSLLIFFFSLAYSPLAPPGDAQFRSRTFLMPPPETGRPWFPATTSHGRSSWFLRG